MFTGTQPRSIAMKLLPLIAVAAVSLVFGCSSTKKHAADQAKSVSGTDEQIFIGDTVEKNYDPNVIIKRAEAFFDKENYPEAIIEYQHFLDLHRVHTLASYAQFKLGESHYKMATTVDRDLEPVRKAIEAFEKLRKEFPGSRYEQEAVERTRACHDLLAQHAFFVGEFYYRRESYLAAAYRFEGILKNYPDMAVVPDAMYYLALSYNELGADEWAREKLIVLAEKYPNNKYAKDGQKLFAKLTGKRPAETAFAKVAPAAQDQGNQVVVSLPQVPAIDLLPSGQPSVTPAAVVPATAVVPVSTFAGQASNGAGTAVNGFAPHSTGLAPQMTLCRLGSWC